MSNSNLSAASTAAPALTKAKMAGAEPAEEAHSKGCLPWPSVTSTLVFALNKAPKTSRERRALPEAVLPHI